MSDERRLVLRSIALDFGQGIEALGGAVKVLRLSATLEELEREGYRVREVTIRDMKTGDVAVYWLARPLDEGDPGHA